MFRFPRAATAALLVSLAASQAPAADLARCPPSVRHHHRHTAALRRLPPQVVYAAPQGRPRLGYNHEDNGVYDGADAPPPVARGQPGSWLDGYGTRPVVYGAYGTYNVYGGSAQVMPWGLGPAGGLSVYSAGGYGPGPSIIRIPDGY